MSKKMPDRFMETGDTHVSGKSFTADELEFLKSEDDEKVCTEDRNGPQKEDIRHSSGRKNSN